ncbi:DUF4355 domain-containing protein [Carnobacteriaceae bacterium zg-ZUI78]|nr:DUF4355 domain-containing protein [Carnobacteriaceae bacterium zg-ZUI78]
MSEFKTIETQEELDRIIGDRLARQKEKYSDYDQLKSRVEELENENGGLKVTLESSKQELSSYTSQIEALNTKVSSYETASLRTRIALQNGLPYDLADRLVGDDEETLKADAEKLASFLKANDPIPPLKSSEPNVGDTEQISLKNMLKDLTNKGV